MTTTQDPPTDTEYHDEDAPPPTDADAPPELTRPGPIVAALEAQLAAERKAEWERQHLPADEETGLHWTRADLELTLAGDITAEQPTILHRTDGQSLLYPGRHHDIHGEPSDGKSWIALAAVRDLLLIGRSCIWVDWEDTSQAFVSRLRALDVPDVVIGNPNDVAFIVPTGPWGSTELHGLLELATDMNAALIVFDAMVDALALDGLDENSNADAARWLTATCRPFNREGIATLALDHVSRDASTRTRGARGGGAKLGFIDGASYATKMVKPFDRNTPGSVKLIIAKDRHGQIGPRGKAAAHVHVTPHDGGVKVELAIQPPDDTPHTPDGQFVPTIYCERVSRFLEARPGEQFTLTHLRTHVDGKDDLILKAVNHLAAEGYADEASGPRNARLFSHARNYRKPEEQDTPDVGGTPPVPTSSPPVPATGEVTSARPPLPYGVGTGLTPLLEPPTHALELGTEDDPYDEDPF